MPSVRSTTSSGGLLLGEKDAAFRGAGRGGLERCGVGRTDLIEVMDVLVEDCALDEWLEHVGQKQIWHRFQTISGCRMSGNVDAEVTQLLHQSPHFGSRGTNLLGDLGAADNDRGIAHQEADDASEASIGLLGRDTLGSFAFWLCLDGGIIRQSLVGGGSSL